MALHCLLEERGRLCGGRQGWRVVLSAFLVPAACTDKSDEVPAVMAHGAFELIVTTRGLSDEDRTLPVQGVHVGARHRSVVDQEKLDALAESMASVGLLQPITVYAPDDATVELVAGLHRLEAARRLGWDNIDAIFMTGSEIDRELAEITENLHRIDLTKEQRDQHTRRYAELLRMREVSPQDAAQPKSGPKGGRPKSVARRIAEETGLSDDTVRRALNPKPPSPRKPVAATPRLGADADVPAVAQEWSRTFSGDMHIAARQLADGYYAEEIEGLIEKLKERLAQRAMELPPHGPRYGTKADPLAVASIVALYMTVMPTVRNEVATLILEHQLLQTDIDQKAKDGLRRVLAVLTDYSPKAA